LGNGFQAFELSADKEKERRNEKVKKLNGIIGRLTVELKKMMTNIKKEAIIS
jgi:hypothetical protein